MHEESYELWSKSPKIKQVTFLASPTLILFKTQHRLLYEYLIRVALGPVCFHLDSLWGGSRVPELKSPSGYPF